MRTCFTNKQDSVTKIYAVVAAAFDGWLSQQSEYGDLLRNWVVATKFQAKAGATLLVPNHDGKLCCVVLVLADADAFWDYGALPKQLPAGNYQLEIDSATLEKAALVWGLGSYQFNHYKKVSNDTVAKLYLPEAMNITLIESQIEATYLVRDLVTMPTEDMGPSELGAQVKQVADQFNAQYNEVVGDELLKQNYPSIHAVGRASDDAPRLLDLRWGDESHPKLTLVGKGVCFDTGGLDMKTPAGMRTMNKDMGGAAHALALAYLVMANQLPVCLRLLIPAVENAIAGNAYRPGDVIKTRKGHTIEIHNTDAEGRVVLSDALAEASTETPDLLVDFATLTGAARIALGTDLPSMFTKKEQTARDLLAHGKQQDDLVWHMPLYQAYRELFKSDIADFSNAATSPWGGAITAALFLENFVEKEQDWIHFDIMAANEVTRAGRPKGGEAQGLRAAFSYISNRYGSVAKR